MFQKKILIIKFLINYINFFLSSYYYKYQNIYKVLYLKLIKYILFHYSTSFEIVLFF